MLSESVLFCSLPVSHIVHLLINFYSLLFALFDSFLFVMVPSLRINSWESWFIFNLQKNKQSTEENSINDKMINDYE